MSKTSIKTVLTVTEAKVDSTVTLLEEAVSPAVRTVAETAIIAAVEMKIMMLGVVTMIATAQRQ